jgi:SAM-dependent methyltransferase
VQGILSKLEPGPAHRMLSAFDSVLGKANLENLADAVLPGRSAESFCLFGEKYLNLGKRMTTAARRVSALGLIESPPLDILDLGAGNGFFCFAAQIFGHRTVAVEPDSYTPENDRIDFAPLMELLSVPHSIQAIQPGQPLKRDFCLKPDQRFDLITSFAIMFNHLTAVSGMMGGEDSSGLKYWSARDYLFFLQDLVENFLKPGGRVLLQFNQPLRGEPKTPHTPAVITDYYRRLGVLLQPFMTSYDREFGALLDLRRPGAWEEARRIDLVPPAPESIKLMAFQAET